VGWWRGLWSCVSTGERVEEQSGLVAGADCRQGEVRSIPTAKIIRRLLREATQRPPHTPILLLFTKWLLPLLFQPCRQPEAVTHHPHDGFTVRVHERLYLDEFAWLCSRCIEKPSTCTLFHCKPFTLDGYRCSRLYCREGKRELHR